MSSEPPPASADSTTGPSAAQPSPFQNVVKHMTEKKVDALLWMTRLATLAFSVLYLIPIGVNPYSCYQKALISNAATSALRLHQRLPNVRLTREFLGLLLIEDSCHYLFFSIIFLYTYPITICLVPIFLFALLHSASYTLALLGLLNMQQSWLSRMVLGMVENHQRNMLRAIALAEIFIMPMTVFMIFSGRGGLLVPFVYFRFLTLRYASRRNPYTRTAFHEMRLIIESFASHQSCPAMVSRILLGVVAFSSRFAPPMPAAN